MIERIARLTSALKFLRKVAKEQELTLGEYIKLNLNLELIFTVRLNNTSLPGDESNTGGEDSDNTRLRQGQYVGFLNTAVVMNQVSRITRNWKNAPNIVVLQNHLQLPEGIREEVTRKLQNGMGAKGLYDGSTGTIYLFSNHLSSMDDVQFTLFHEAYGHLGLRLMFGQEFDTFLNNIYNSNANVRRAADARQSYGT